MSASSAVARAKRPPPEWLRAWPALPLVVLMLVLLLYPVMQILILSAFDRAGNLSFSNYTRLTTSSAYIQTLWITFHISGWTAIGSVVLGFAVSYHLATSAPRLRAFLTFLVLLPFWTSFLVRSFAWMILLGREGPLNKLLIGLGIAAEPVGLIYNFTGVMIGMIHAMLPFAIITMLSVMETVDPGLTRAAQTLGARNGQAFWRIYFPLALPGVAAAGLLVFATAIGFFITPELLGGAQQIMISQVIIRTVQELLDFRFAGALSVVLLVATGILFYIYHRLLGIATLTGDATSAAPRSSRPVGRRRLFAFVRPLAAMGWLTDQFAIFRERWQPVNPTRPPSTAKPLLWTVSIIVLTLMTLPSLFIIPVSFTQGNFITFPPEGFSLRWYEAFLGSPIWINATIRSIVVALLTAALSTVLGTATAFVLVRQQVFGKVLVLLFILSPLVLPRIVLGVGLFYLYARIGLLGTIPGLVLGHTIIAVPYVVITVMAVLRTYDERLDQAAWSLGASRWRTFYRITLPRIRAGIIAGFLFALITSFDDLTIALFISGGAAATLPRQMWTDLLLQFHPTLAAVAVVMLVGVTIVNIVAQFLRHRAVAA